MPIVKMGNKEYKIPFHPKFIANCLYRGLEVYPDEGASEEQLKSEQDLINQQLQQLWKNQPMRTVPGRKEPDRDWPKSMPESGLTNPVDPGWTGIPGQQGEHNFLKVMPNPTINYQIRDVGTVPPNRLEAQVKPQTALGPTDLALWEKILKDFLG